LHETSPPRSDARANAVSKTLNMDVNEQQRKTQFRRYCVVTAGYWGFTVTDGAIRMLVVLYFHLLGYSPFDVAMLFLLYEFFGMVTNLVGGWLGARIGVNRTMHLGMALQILALGMLAVPDSWLSVPYVMLAQALSGIAKDLNKMSAKTSVKALVGQSDGLTLYKWTAVLTGSKNSLKGGGFFLGALLLETLGFRGAVAALAAGLAIVLIATLTMLSGDVGKMSGKPKFSQVFSNSSTVNWLCAARFFLFGSRDIWFVVALPVFLYSVLGWTFVGVGSFLAAWVVGYGIVQTSAPRFVRARNGRPPDGRAACRWAFVLALVPASIAIALIAQLNPTSTVTIGVAVFGVVFAINSALHSYLILAYAEADKAAMTVGFYYMANAGGRLVGTIISGWGYQQFGLSGCLLLSTGFVLMAAIISLALPGAYDQKNDQGGAFSETRFT
jgi:predicted MFS family arabinose efflux permease